MTARVELLIYRRAISIDTKPFFNWHFRDLWSLITSHEFPSEWSPRDWNMPMSFDYPMNMFIQSVHFPFIFSNGNCHLFFKSNWIFHFSIYQRISSNHFMSNVHIIFFNQNYRNTYSNHFMSPRLVPLIWSNLPGQQLQAPHIPSYGDWNTVVIPFNCTHVFVLYRIYLHLCI